jgi:hypothetical protein
MAPIYVLITNMGIQYREKQNIETSPCLEFKCSDKCCTYGADVEVDEYNLLISMDLAKPSDFTGPEECDGELLYRTVLGPRGCIFLRPKRGCRLHDTPYKPLICKIFPRDEREAQEAHQDGYLPCITWYLAREKE